MPTDEFVARSGNVIEHGGSVSPGLRELRINTDRIFLQTKLGAPREFPRSSTADHPNEDIVLRKAISVVGATGIEPVASAV